MIKKIIYGSAWGLLGTEATIVALKFYNLYKANTMLYLIGGIPLVPYWLIAEGCMVGIAPILTKYVLKSLNNNGLSDESELVGLIKNINKRKDRTNGVE